jgi:hypothetical protein
VPLGYVLGVLAAMVVLSYGVFTEGVPRFPTPPEWAIGAMLTSAVAVTFAAYLFLPAVIAIVVGEAFGLRSAIYWLAAGGLFGILPGFLPQFWRSPPPDRILLPFAAAGLAWGLVYWLVAGRLAGRGFSRELPPGPA